MRSGTRLHRSRRNGTAPHGIRQKLLFTAINTALLLTQGIFTVMQTDHALIISAVITAAVLIINGKQVFTTVTDILKKRKPKTEPAEPAADGADNEDTEAEETEETEETNEQNSGDNV